MRVPRDYLAEMEFAPKKDVTPEEFERAALDRGWDPLVIAVFLVPPYATTEDRRTGPVAQQVRGSPTTANGAGSSPARTP